MTTDRFRFLPRECPGPLPVAWRLRLAAAVLAFAVGVLCVSGARTVADERRLDPCTIKESVERDCKVFRVYWHAKRGRIQDAAKRGRDAEVKLLAERLQTEEARALGRIVWYVGNDRKAKDQVAKLQAILDRTSKLGPDEWLKLSRSDGFKPPRWVLDPFSPAVGDEAAAPTGSPASTKPQAK